MTRSFEVGARYELRIKGRGSRRFVLDFIGEGSGKLNFSARPLAGTQSLNPADIVSAIQVDKTQPIKV